MFWVCWPNFTLNAAEKIKWYNILNPVPRDSLLLKSWLKSIEVNQHLSDELPSHKCTVCYHNNCHEPYWLGVQINALCVTLSKEPLSLLLHEGGNLFKNIVYLQQSVCAEVFYFKYAIKCFLGLYRGSWSLDFLST